jgi:hypothetical protein
VTSAGRRRVGSAGNGWQGCWVLTETWSRRSTAAERSARSGGSASAWTSEGSARTARPRRKRACSASRRSSAAAYGEEGRPLPPPRGALDGVGRGVEGKRKDRCADRRGGTASRRCAAWRPVIGAGSGICWWGTAVDSPMRGMDCGLRVRGSWSAIGWWFIRK